MPRENRFALRDEGEGVDVGVDDLSFQGGCRGGLGGRGNKSAAQTSPSASSQWCAVKCACIHCDLRPDPFVEYVPVMFLPAILLTRDYISSTSISDAVRRFHNDEIKSIQAIVFILS